MYDKKGNLLPNNLKYFKEDVICQLIDIYSNKPDIDNILSFMIYPEISNIKAIKTLEATSEDGVKLTGTKLIVQIKLNEKLTYSSISKNNSVHGLHYEHYTTLTISLPNEVNSHNVIDLVNCNRLKVSAFMEANHTRLFNKRQIFSCGLLLVNAKFCI